MRDHHSACLSSSGFKEGAQQEPSGGSAALLTLHAVAQARRAAHPPPPSPPSPAALPTCINLQRQQGPVAEGVGHHLYARHYARRGGDLQCGRLGRPAALGHDASHNAPSPSASMLTRSLCPPSAQGQLDSCRIGSWARAAAYAPRDCRVRGGGARSRTRMGCCRPQQQLPRAAWPIHGPCRPAPCLRPGGSQPR